MLYRLCRQAVLEVYKKDKSRKEYYGKIKRQSGEHFAIYSASLINQGLPAQCAGNWRCGRTSFFFYGAWSFRLEKAGYIRRDKDKPRAIEIIHPDYIPESYSSGSYAEASENSTIPLPLREMVDIPILGQVAAGLPILADENVEDYFALPLHFLPRTNAELFILKIRGDSMINIGLYDGDYVIVSQQNTARNNDVVVALIDDSATVKTFFREKDHIRLQPENDDYEPILVKDVTILGKVIALYRRF